MADTPSAPADPVREAVLHAPRRGYDAPEGDWIQNPTPVRSPARDN